jgi:hypothetical protein
VPPSSQVREQLWRRYPQLLELTDDVAANWVLALRAKASTAAEATRLTEKKIARVLTAHRIRRITASDALATRERIQRVVRTVTKNLS